jgi:hypothetical protein
MLPNEPVATMTSPFCRVFHRDLAVRISTLEKFSRLDADRTQIAVGARFAVDLDFELPAPVAWPQS